MFSLTKSVIRSQTFQSLRFQSTQAYKDSIALLKTDLKKSMLAKDTIKRDTIKGLLSNIKNKEIDAKPSQHNEFLLYELFNKNINQRKDSVKEYQKLNRKDLSDKEILEIEIIQNYLNSLPVASSEEIESKVKEFLIEILRKEPNLKLNQIFGKLNWNQIKIDWKASESQVKSQIVKLFKELSKQN
ncbi:hypothetical protein WICMUC_003766 [Wickerhamomyces mucosus]|uniref:Altered inheritance of mitochondria protein 41 n=1 Tax=Wickerhamomyces mucosus TaxID=1378264 RepID=A0A9P8TBS2_9ASCO|nr:hypothetical protein WICMUC_003766 [Wickerhamomyces mucosus]